MSSMKTCPGYGEDVPHELLLTKANFSMKANGRPTHAHCRTHQAARDSHYLRTEERGTLVRRPTEKKGVYLAAIKLADGSMLVKIGKTGDGLSGFRSRAGTLAKDTRRREGLDVEWAELMYVIEEDDADMRTELEALILEEATPIVGKEYFAGTDFDSFVTMVWMGRPYTERTTSYDRRHQFFQWLAKMDGLET